MLNRAYKKILENNQLIMREQRERIEQLKLENARLSDALKRAREAEQKNAPVETYVAEIERLHRDEYATPRQKPQIEYMSGDELDRLLAEYGIN